MKYGNWEDIKIREIKGHREKESWFWNNAENAYEKVIKTVVLIRLLKNEKGSALKPKEISSKEKRICLS